MFLKKVKENKLFFNYIFFHKVRGIGNSKLIF